MTSIDEKYEKLKQRLFGFQKVAIAFSGGVDSTFLLKTARDVLGDGAVAFIACSGFMPQRERREAEEFCEQEKIPYVICQIKESELGDVVQNPPNRCYLCKSQLLKKIKTAAADCGITVIAEGSNMDDKEDYRPGEQAVKEQGVKSPLQEAKLTKTEIRELSRRLGLSTWKKPSAACLASRFVYGEKITEEKLRMVEMAEEFLAEKGFSQFRVRIHERMARIEVMPQEIKRLAEETLRAAVYQQFRSLGFSYVTLDLGGYRTGSMNETLRPDSMK